MSQRDAQVIREFFESWNESEDVDLAISYFHPEIEFQISSQLGRASPDLQVAHGIEEVRKLVSEFIAAFDSFHFEVERYLDAGERVVVLLEGFGRMGDAPPIPTNPYAYVCTVRDGKILRMEDYPSQADALAAVGLSQAAD